MNWFIPAIICTLGWGCADLFYKRSNSDDRYSHLKTAVWVGLVMGAAALCLLPFSESGMSAGAIVRGAVLYAPASLCYIISMVIGYAGLRYLELSIVSPVQNASGALSAICMLVYFTAAGRISGISDEFSALDLIGTAAIAAGVIALAFAEQRISAQEKQAVPVSERKYISGALALVFPLLYCLFDTLGTAADGVILDEETGLGLGEIDVIILYGLTFFVAGTVAWLYMMIRTKKPYNPVAKGEGSKALAAVFEQIGQIFYVYAMAARPVLAAPMVASYCIVSVILSRLLLREKLKLSQYICVAAVICGIVLLGVSEGISEA